MGPSRLAAYKFTRALIERLMPFATCTGEAIISCSGSAGEFLLFAPATLRGAYTLSIGAVFADIHTRKDTLSISPFICQKM